MDATSTQAPGCPLSDELSRLRVVLDDGGQPTLLRPEGTAVDPWRERYPYPERMTRAEYDVQKRRLQVELLKLRATSCTGCPTTTDLEVVTVPDPLLVGSASEVFEDDDRSGPLFPTV